MILTVVRHLSRRAFAPHLAVGRASGPLHREIPEDVPVHRLPGERVRYAVPGLVRLTRRIRPKAVLSTLGHLNLALLAARRLLPPGTRLLVREANTPSARLMQTYRPGLYRWAYRRLYPLADRVICNSAFMRADLADRFSVPGEKIAVIPNPVDRERIRLRLEGRGDPYEGGGVRLVSVGRLNRQKGYDLLLAAMHGAVNEAPGLRLTLVGDGEERGELEALVRRLGLGDSVAFAGHRENPYPFMAYADLFVSSSRFEGSPNAVLEALACGTPVLAFDCPGGTGEIIGEGLNGWLVPAEDTEAMAAGLIEIAGRRAWEAMDAERLLPGAYECAGAVSAYEALLGEG